MKFIRNFKISVQKRSFKYWTENKIKNMDTVEQEKSVNEQEKIEKRVEAG